MAGDAELHRVQAVRCRFVLCQHGHLEAAAGHAQVLHRLRHCGAQLGRGFVAQARDALGLMAIHPLGIQRLAFQCVQIGGCIQCLKLGLPAGQQRRQFGRAAAVAARQRHPAADAAIQFRQPLGVGLAVVEITRQRVRRVFNLRLRGAQDLGHCAQIGVVALHLVQRGDGA